MLVIRNAQVFCGTGDPIRQADIQIADGRIVAVGPALESPSDARVINAAGLFAMPGLVDAHSHIGGFGSGGEQDLNEMTGNATPAVESFYAIDTKSKEFERAIRAGITTSVIAPGSGNVVGGMVCAVKSAGRSIRDMCIKNPVALKMALGGNPKGVYGKRNQMPMTRMGIAHVIREQLTKARTYLQKQEQAAGDPAKMPDYDQGLENVARVLRKEIPIKVHCEQFDMMTTLQIAEEFDILCTIDHAWGASDFYDEIAGAKNLVGIIFGPTGVPLLPGECGKVDIECLAELDRRGVVTAIMTDGPIMNPELLVGQAGEAVRTGTPHERALMMLTRNAAVIAGIEDRVGSLEPGKDADIILFRGIPARDTAARCVHAVINGETVFAEASDKK